MIAHTHYSPCRQSNRETSSANVLAPPQLGCAKVIQYQSAILCMQRIWHKLYTAASSGIFTVYGEAAWKQCQLARVGFSSARAGCFGNNSWQGSCMAESALQHLMDKQVNSSSMSPCHQSGSKTQAMCIKQNSLACAYKQLICLSLSGDCF